MSKLKLRYLLSVIMLAAFLVGIPHNSQAATKTKHKIAQQVEKERLVLMPLRLGEEDQKLQGAIETALVESLQQKYEVFSGEQVAKKAHEIFNKESHNTAHKECDETRCLQGIAEAFQAELLAIASVTKQDGGYFLALSIRNLYDNKDVYSKSLPCEGCNAFKAVEKIKELVGAPATIASAPTSEAPQPKVNQNDPDAVLWAEAQKGNTVEDYKVYLDTYSKGKYVPFAKARIKKLNDATQAAAVQQEQSAWDTAQQEASEDSYGVYVKGYPTGRFAGLANVRLDKLKNDVAAKEETSLWNKADSSNDQAAIKSYLNRYPSGRYVVAASAKLKAQQKEEAERQVNEEARQKEETRQRAEVEAAARQSVFHQMVGVWKGDSMVATPPWKDGGCQGHEDSRRQMTITEAPNESLAVVITVNKTLTATGDTDCIFTMTGTNRANVNVTSSGHISEIVGGGTAKGRFEVMNCSGNGCSSSPLVTVGTVYSLTSKLDGNKLTFTYENRQTVQYTRN